jgi:hypothetical protein
MKQESVEWKMGFGSDDQLKNLIMSKNPFLLPPEFYKNLFAASAILQKPNQAQNECNKLFNAQNFPRNLLFSCGVDDKEVKAHSCPPPPSTFSAGSISLIAPLLKLMIAIFLSHLLALVSPAESIVGILMASRAI